MTGWLYRKKGGGPGGTDKQPVIGAVERDGNVVAQVADDVTGKGVLNFIRPSVSPATQIHVGFMSLFVAEAAWKYNHRKEARPWDAFMESVFA